MRYLLLIVLATAICAGCWTEQEVVTDVTTDADSDSDSDSDSDTGSDSESASDSDSETEEEGCGVPSGITDWGGPCHSDADCPPDTECAILNSVDDTQGFCAPDCCNFETADAEYCTDVSTGLEGCYLLKNPEDEGDILPPFHCIIICNTQDDCPTDTACLDLGGYGTSICYGYAL